jgi:hypothetical protein
LMYHFSGKIPCPGGTSENWVVHSNRPAPSGDMQKMAENCGGRCRDRTGDLLGVNDGPPRKSGLFSTSTYGISPFCAGFVRAAFHPGGSCVPPEPLGFVGHPQAAQASNARAAAGAEHGTVPQPWAAGAATPCSAPAAPL